MHEMRPRSSSLEVVIGSPNVNPGFRLANNKDYPEIAVDFAKTFEILKSLPCDVFLGAHGGYYGMVERYALLKKGQANAFVNPEGYKEYVAQKERAFRKTLVAKQGTPQDHGIGPDAYPSARSFLAWRYNPYPGPAGKCATSIPRRPLGDHRRRDPTRRAALTSRPPPPPRTRASRRACWTGTRPTCCPG
jgi:hypothetical protein